MNSNISLTTLVLAITLTTILFADRATWAQSEPQSFNNLSAEKYQEKFDNLVPKGFCPTSILVKVVNKQDRYDLTMQKMPGTKFVSRHLLPDPKFEKLNEDLKERGYSLSIHQKYSLNKKNLNVAVWTLTTQFKPLGTIWTDPNSVPSTGQATLETKPIDEMMSAFLAKHQIPGATLAIGYQGNIVYSRGFGYSDIANKQLMEPDMRLRIASVSKPLTGAAILQLIDQGKLSLDDKVFAKLPFKPVSNVAKPDSRLDEITISHLLRHTGGWDRSVSYDAMFRQKIVAKHVGASVPVGPPEIIRYMLSQELDHNPGTKYAYSNFGYSVLGRIIEQASGMDYESYVQQNILKPVGAERMQIGKTKLDERLDDEPLYYTRSAKYVDSLLEDKKVTEPYGRWYLESFDSHGGWIASAPDLVKFVSAFDDPRKCKLMSGEAVSAMFVPPSVGTIEPSNATRRFYACGWQMVMFADGKRFNAYHSGLFSGSSTMIVRRHDGFNWAVLFNTDRTIDNKLPSGEIDSLIHKAVNYVKDSK